MRNPIKNAWYSLWHDHNHFKFAIIRRMPWLIKDDKKYLSLLFECAMGYPMNWDNPITFNEKLQWLKLYNRRPEYVQMVDKIAVKDYVASIIGKEYIIPTISVWDKPADIEWDSLPEKFVIKTNHDGGGHGIVICSDKKKFDKKTAIKELSNSYNRSSYSIGREWGYKYVKHRILAETYMESEGGDLKDYKFFCFDGEVKALYVATERSSGDVKFDFFDAEWNHLDIMQAHPMSGKLIEKPQTFDLMKQLASKLSKGIPHVRVDFYEINGKPYFGEMTLYNRGGLVPFTPAKWDEIFGSWITLPKQKTI